MKDTKGEAEEVEEEWKEEEVVGRRGGTVAFSAKIIFTVLSASA